MKTFFAILAAGFALLPSLVAKEAPAIPSDYPLKSCPVSGEALGSGGMVAYKVNHKGTDVWLCCKMCERKFQQSADEHAKKVRDAAAAK